MPCFLAGSVLLNAPALAAEGKTKSTESFAAKSMVTATHNVVENGLNILPDSLKNPLKSANDQAAINARKAIDPHDKGLPTGLRKTVEDKAGKTLIRGALSEQEHRNQEVLKNIPVVGNGLNQINKNTTQAARQVFGAKSPDEKQTFGDKVVGKIERSAGAPVLDGAQAAVKKAMPKP